MRDLIATGNTTTLKPLGKVRAGWITGVTWSPDGLMTAVACANGVRLYVEKFGGEPSHVLTGHEGHVKDAVFSADNRLLASVGADMRICLWDVTDPENSIDNLATWQGHEDSIDTVAFSPDGRMLVTGSADGSIQLWNLETGQTAHALRGHEREVSGIVYALGGNVIVSGSWDGTLRLWDARGETEGTILGHHDDWVRDVQANPPGTMIASASKDATVRLWDAHSGEMYANIYAHWHGADSVAFSPDGALLATGGRDNVVRLWDVQSVLSKGKAEPADALITLEGHEKPVLCLSFNPAGTLLASGSGDNTVNLWGIT